MKDSLNAIINARLQGSDELHRITTENGKFAQITVQSAAATSGSYFVEAFEVVKQSDQSC